MSCNCNWISLVYDHYDYIEVSRSLLIDNTGDNFAKPKRLKSTDSKQKIKRASRRESDESFEKDYGHQKIQRKPWRHCQEDSAIMKNCNQLFYEPSPRNVAKARWSKGFDLFIKKEERYYNKPQGAWSRNPYTVDHTTTNGELWTRSAHQHRYDKFSWCSTPEVGLEALWEDCQWPAFKKYAKRASRRQGKRETKIQLNEFYEEKAFKKQEAQKEYEDYMSIEFVFGSFLDELDKLNYPEDYAPMIDYQEEYYLGYTYEEWYGPEA